MLSCCHSLSKTFIQKFTAEKKQSPFPSMICLLYFVDHKLLTMLASLSWFPEEIIADVLASGGTLVKGVRLREAEGRLRISS